MLVLRGSDAADDAAVVGRADALDECVLEADAFQHPLGAQAAGQFSHGGDAVLAAQKPRLRQAVGTLRRHPPHRRAEQDFHHPQVGTITLGFQGMQLEGTPGQRLGIYLAEPGTPHHDAIILLDMTAPRRTEQPAVQQKH